MYLRSFIVFIIFTLSSQNLMAQPLKCNGDSLSRKFLLEEIQNAEPGDFVPFETHYLVGMRPPESFESNITILNSQSKEMVYANKVYQKSKDSYDQAVQKALDNPDHLERYRKNCLFDDSTDEEILARGVEVVLFVATLSNGDTVESQLMTSLRPEGVSNQDMDFAQFKSLVDEKVRTTGASVELYEIYHNHPRADTLSLADVDFAAAFSYDFAAPTQVIAFVEHDGKLSAIRSKSYALK